MEQARKEELRTALFSLAIAAAVLGGIWAYRNLLITIVTVTGPTEYTIRRRLLNTDFTYTDREGHEHTLCASAPHIINNSAAPLRLYKIPYSTTSNYLTGPKEETLEIIEPNTAVAVDAAPDYILEEPPSSLKVKRSIFDASPTEWRTVLEVY
ncbi:MAG: hypothetical protein IJS59_01815 [Bacteroidaceae bacterium]|nr:hypothetical protein [Bacteroidaceae bacterium]